MTGQAMKPLKPEFVMGKADENAPKTVKNVAKLEAFLVEYVDGEGNKEVRICFQVPGASSTFMLQERINGVFVATAAQDWFHKALKQKLTEQKGVESV
jgi:hypothetical protein